MCDIFRKCTDIDQRTYGWYFLEKLILEYCGNVILRIYHFGINVIEFNKSSVCVTVQSPHTIYTEGL